MIFILVVLITTALGDNVDYKNYHVFRINPKTEVHVQALQDWEQTEKGFSYWTWPSGVNKTVDLMVSPDNLSQFYSLAHIYDLPFKSTIKNVQAVIDAQVPVMQPASYDSGRPYFDFYRYHSLENIYAYMDHLANTHPNIAKVVVAGQSYENRPIKGIILTFSSESKPGIFLEGGMHAREWIAPATVMYLLYQLLHSTDPDVRALAEKHDWYIFPMFNPDGYVYTQTRDRMWRKTRSPNGKCVGADPNRNWGFHWSSSGDPCSEIHSGTQPFSEVETRTMSDYIGSISSKFYAYIAFHSYSQLLLFPYGHTKQPLDNFNELTAIGRETVQALSRKYGTRYNFGSIARVLYPAYGSSMDWVKGTFHTPITYCYELRDTGRHGFLLPPDEIIPTGEETLDSLVAMFKASERFGYPKKSRS